MIDWVGFVPAAVLASLVPGANQLLGLRNAVRHGSAYALAGIGGRLAAFVVLIGLVVVGLDVLLSTGSAVLTVIKWIGVAYLLWIGLTSLRHAWRPRPAAPAGSPADSGRTLWPLVANEFVVAMSNPKALLLFAALLPQFTGGPDAAAGPQLALLGAAYLPIELVVGLGYVGLGSALGATGISARTHRKIDAGSGVCFLGLAGLLAAEHVAL
ncbi:LysE family translocator [Nonomuraea jiangxiensis]|uniref:Threonine/homoserine/homoserine lactone efflux protein n=1 Tax=Nonomuraea jiangxiensis TaxID=633440 RepID=A0A1G8TYW2_9ACTN|nr:LysE family translocator [Nonomuraea jiangxiensis]SDJ45920.1 Threonine/homoserine/homoserine lactone efflux protein [Nonomuraea jiangxiensis]